MKTSLRSTALIALCLSWTLQSQTVNSGSNGSDGAFNPTTSTVVDMADHPDGIYHYTSVHIPSGVLVTFKPNPRNTPVVWLVKGDCAIYGAIDVSGRSADGLVPGIGGPGGFSGGGIVANLPQSGLGPGGGTAKAGSFGGNAGFASEGSGVPNQPALYGLRYGNQYLLPLIGGSGGAGGMALPGQVALAGGGGGGAFLLVCDHRVRIDSGGSVSATGGGGWFAVGTGSGGWGSGGAVRIVASEILGNSGSVDCRSGGGGAGWIRFDSPNNNFHGQVLGVSSSGFQPIILPALGNGLHLAIQNIGGVAVSPNPTGLAASPDAVLPASLQNPVPVIVRCLGVPLGTDIRVEARGVSGEPVVGIGKNTTGTLADSLATVPVHLPRGSGILIARARVAVTSGPGGSQGASVTPSAPTRSSPPSTQAAAPQTQGTTRLSDLPYSITGLTTDGERIATVELEAALGGGSQTVYVTESGKRIPAPTAR